MMPDGHTLRYNTANEFVTPPAKPQSATLSPLALRNSVFCLLLILATFVVYYPSLHNGFVNYDDPRYVMHNPNIQSGLTWQSLYWAVTAYYESNWHPLTWMSHALDISLFRLNPARHHAVNILIHVLNALLLFFVLQDATKRGWQ